MFFYVSVLQSATGKVVYDRHEGNAGEGYRQ
jgi:hypothetical protein